MDENKNSEIPETQQTQQLNINVNGSAFSSYSQETNLTQETINKAPSRWKVIFIILLIANILTIILPLLAIFFLSQMAKNGESGTEFIALLLIPVLMIGFIVGVLNIVLIISYIRKRKPAQPAKTIGIIIIVISLLLICVPGALLIKNNLPWYLDSSGQVEKIRKESKKKFSASIQVTLEEATTQLNNCQLEGVAYVELIGQENKNNAEKVSSGLVISEIKYNSPHTLFVADRMISQIKPIAEQAKKQCPSLIILDREGAVLNENSNWVY